MNKIIIECEELPSLREAEDFFKEVLIAYKKDCETAEFEYGFQKIKVSVE